MFPASPTMFSSDEDEEQPLVRRHSSTATKGEMDLLHKLNILLSGIPPPPSLATCRLSHPDMLEKLRKFSDFFSSPSLSNPLLESNPKVYYLNSGQVSEEIANLMLKTQARFVQSETLSTCTSSFQSLTVSGKKRRQINQGVSPGRRLSHLARRRQVFSRANLQKLSQNEPTGHRLEIKASVVSQRQLAKNYTESRRLLKPALPKRALFQSPEDELMRPGFRTINRQLPRRKLFGSEDKKQALVPPSGNGRYDVSSWIASQNFEGGRKRMREGTRESDRKRRCPRRSLDFSDSSPSRCSEASSMFTISHHLSDVHKKKLLWAVSVALKEKNITHKDSFFKPSATALFSLCRKNITCILNSTVNGGTSEKMLHFARQQVSSILLEEQSKTGVLKDVSGSTLNSQHKERAEKEICKGKENAPASFTPRKPLLERPWRSCLKTRRKTGRHLTRAKSCETLPDGTLDPHFHSSKDKRDCLFLGDSVVRKLYADDLSRSNNLTQFSNTQGIENVQPPSKCILVNSNPSFDFPRRVSIVSPRRCNGEATVVPFGDDMAPIANDIVLVEATPVKTNQLTTTEMNTVPETPEESDSDGNCIIPGSMEDDEIILFPALLRRVVPVSPRSVGVSNRGGENSDGCDEIALTLVENKLNSMEDENFPHEFHVACTDTNFSAIEESAIDLGVLETTIQSIDLEDFDNSELPSFLSSNSINFENSRSEFNTYEAEDTHQQMQKAVKRKLSLSTENIFHLVCEDPINVNLSDLEGRGDGSIDLTSCSKNSTPKINDSETENACFDRQTDSMLVNPSVFGNDSLLTENNNFGVEETFCGAADMVNSAVPEWTAKEAAIVEFSVITCEENQYCEDDENINEIKDQSFDENSINEITKLHYNSNIELTVANGTIGNESLIDVSQKADDCQVEYENVDVILRESLDEKPVNSVQDCSLKEAGDQLDDSDGALVMNENEESIEDTNILHSMQEIHDVDNVCTSTPVIHMPKKLVMKTKPAWKIEQGPGLTMRVRLSKEWGIVGNPETSGQEQASVSLDESAINTCDESDVKDASAIELKKVDDTATSTESYCLIDIQNRMAIEKTLAGEPSREDIESSNCSISSSKNLISCDFSGSTEKCDIITEKCNRSDNAVDCTYVYGGNLLSRDPEEKESLLPAEDLPQPRTPERLSSREKDDFAVDCSDICGGNLLSRNLDEKESLLPAEDSPQPRTPERLSSREKDDFAVDCSDICGGNLLSRDPEEKESLHPAEDSTQPRTPERLSSSEKDDFAVDCSDICGGNLLSRNLDEKESLLPAEDSPQPRTPERLSSSDEDDLPLAHFSAKKQKKQSVHRTERGSSVDSDTPLVQLISSSGSSAEKLNIDENIPLARLNVKKERRNKPEILVDREQRESSVDDDAPLIELISSKSCSAYSVETRQSIDENVSAKIKMLGSSFDDNRQGSPLASFSSRSTIMVEEASKSIDEDAPLSELVPLRSRSLHSYTDSSSSDDDVPLILMTDSSSRGSLEKKLSTSHAINVTKSNDDVGRVASIVDGLENQINVISNVSDNSSSDDENIPLLSLTKTVVGEVLDKTANLSPTRKEKTNQENDNNCVDPFFPFRTLWSSKKTHVDRYIPVCVPDATTMEGNESSSSDLTGTLRCEPQQSRGSDSTPLKKRLLQRAAPDQKEFSLIEEITPSSSCLSRFSSDKSCDTPTRKTKLSLESYKARKKLESQFGAKNKIEDEDWKPRKVYNIRLKHPVHSHEKEKRHRHRSRSSKDSDGELNETPKYELLDTSERYFLEATPKGVKESHSGEPSHSLERNEIMIAETPPGSHENDLYHCSRDPRRQPILRDCVYQTDTVNYDHEKFNQVFRETKETFLDAMKKVSLVVEQQIEFEINHRADEKVRRRKLHKLARVHHESYRLQRSIENHPERLLLTALVVQKAHET